MAWVFPPRNPASIVPTASSGIKGLTKTKVPLGLPWNCAAVPRRRKPAAVRGIVETTAGGGGVASASPALMREREGKGHWRGSCPGPVCRASTFRPVNTIWCFWLAGKRGVWAGKSRIWVCTSVLKAAGGRFSSGIFFFFFFSCSLF